VANNWQSISADKLRNIKVIYIYYWCWYLSYCDFVGNINPLFQFSFKSSASSVSRNRPYSISQYQYGLTHHNDKINFIQAFPWRQISARKNLFLQFAEHHNFNPLVPANWYATPKTDFLSLKVLYYGLFFSLTTFYRECMRC
jgi:hypothetical protein